MIKNNKGITLMALIITIIIMLILVAIIVSMAVNGGLFKYAGNAAVDTKTAKEGEQQWTSVEEGMSTEYLIAKYQYGADKEHVARIGSTLYTSIQSAVDAVGENNAQPTEIILLRNTAEGFTIPANKKVLLNLDNNQITNDGDNPIITLNGFLKLKKGRIAGTYGSDVPTIIVNSDAEINLSNTNVSRNSEDEFQKETVSLYGTLKMDSGKIDDKNLCAIWAYANSHAEIEISGTAELFSGGSHGAIYNEVTSNCVITGGKINATTSNAIVQYGTLEISGTAELTAEGTYPVLGMAAESETTIRGGKIYSNRVCIAVLEGANVTIYGGDFYSIEKLVINNYGNMTITGGKFKSPGNTIKQKGTMEVGGTAEINGYGDTPTFYTYEGSTTTINGGTIISENSNAINNNGTINISGTVNIRGLKIHCPAFANHGVATIDGGILYSAYSYGIWNFATANISGGSFTAERSAAFFNESGATATITGGTFTGNTSISNSGTCTVSGATLNGKTSGLD